MDPSVMPVSGKKDSCIIMDGYSKILGNSFFFCEVGLALPVKSFRELLISLIVFFCAQGIDLTKPNIDFMVYISRCFFVVSLMLIKSLF